MSVLVGDQLSRVLAVCDKPTLSYSGGGLNVGQIRDVLRQLDFADQKLLNTGKRAQLTRALCRRYKEIQSQAKEAVDEVCASPLRNKNDDGGCPRFFTSLRENFVDKYGNVRTGSKRKCCRPSLKSAAKEVMTTLSREMPVLEDVNEIKGLSVKDKRAINEKLKAINAVSWDKVKDEPTASFKAEWAKAISDQLAKNIDDGTIKVDEYGKPQKVNKEVKKRDGDDDNDEPEIKELRQWEKSHGANEKEETWLQWMLRWGKKLVSYGISMGVWIARNPLIAFVISAIVDDLLKVVCDYIRTNFLATEYLFAENVTAANLRISWGNWISKRAGLISIFLYTAVQQFPFVESIQKLYNTYAIGSSISTVIGAVFGTASMMTTALSYTFSAILNYSAKIGTETVLLSLTGKRLASMYLTITETCFRPLTEYTQDPDLLKGEEFEKLSAYIKRQREIRKVMNIDPLQFAS